MTEPLFHTYDLRRTVESQGQSLAKEINSLSENEVLNTSQEDMVKYLAEKWRINPLAVDESGIHMDYGDAQIDVSGDMRRAIFNRSGPFYITGTRVTFYVPFTGDLNLFRCQPSTSSLSPPRATIKSNELVFSYDLTEERTSEVKGAFERDLDQTLVHAERVNAEAVKFNTALPETARQRLAARREKLLQDRNLVVGFGFPLRRTQSPPSTFVTPDVKRRITPQKPRVSSEPFSPESTLDVGEYEYILAVLSNMVVVMERSPRAFKDMGEEDLRTHFLVHLNGHYEGQATGETFNYEGKTDILIRVDGRNIFIAECKFWTGPAGLTKALNQLLGYTAWRDTKTALLIFIRDRNMSTVLKAVAKTTRNHPSYKREQHRNPETEFRYVFGHRDDAKRELTVTILVFDVPA